MQKVTTNGFLNSDLEAVVEEGVVEEDLPDKGVVVVEGAEDVEEVAEVEAVVEAEEGDVDVEAEVWIEMTEVEEAPMKEEEGVR